jgi:two-component system sensor histidine kinase VicK
MESQEGSLANLYGRITQLEQENQALKEEVKHLYSTYQTSFSKLEKQLAIEKKYQESQERFRIIFEQSKFGNKIINSDLQIIQVNKALQVILGYSDKELVGTRITDYAHPDFVKHWQQLQECLWMKDIPFFQIDTCLFKKDGSLIWCGITTILFKENETTFGYTILEDITERKLQEEKLEKQTAMINDDLENFIYTASHDLKSPIANLEGLTIALTKSLTKNFTLDNEQNKLLSMIGASTDRLKATIADLTEIAKAQKEDVEDEIVVIDKLIEEVYLDLGKLIADTPVKLHKQIAVNEIKFAKKNIQSIFYNLLSNAIKYASDKRTLQISIETELQENYLVIGVKDNGIGISETDLPKLFTMFKRFHTHVEGTGIGLYIVKRIVENAGGRITVESKLDEGTNFTIYLPFYQ